MFKRKKERTITEQINKKLKGDMQKNALDFIAFMKENDILPDKPDGNCYSCNDAFVCVLCVYPDGKKIGWSIFIGSYDCALCREENQAYPIDDELKAFAWSHVSTCGHFSSGGKHCGCGGQPGKSIKLFGREFHNICTSILCIRNAEGVELEKAKRLAIVWKQSNGG